MAHLSRTGVSGTPTSSSRSSLGSAATSLALRPLTSSVSIDVADWLMAQPRPENFTSSIVSPSSPKATRDRDLVAAERVHPLGLGVRVLDLAVVPRVLVVVEDVLPVELVHQPNTFRTRWSPWTRRSISSGIV